MKMPYQVQHIISGKGSLVCVNKDETISQALSLMIEHDFSQLPVVKKIDGPIEREIPEGMITYESIARGMRNFKAKIDNLRVRDVMVAAPIYNLEDDLFDILDPLNETNAVLVVDESVVGPGLVGIVTSYDTIEYFRNRTEDLMRVEDIEMMVKEFIKAAYVDRDGGFDAARLNSVITRITPRKNKNSAGQKEKTFDDLNLSEYTTLLVLKETWPFLGPIFGVQRSFVIELLNGVREIRNALAHFRGDLSAEQRDKLKFGAEWLSRCQEEYQARKAQQETERLAELFRKQDAAPRPKTVREEFGLYDPYITGETGVDGFAVTESAISGGRYARLADWLQSQPGRVDQVQLTIKQIEEIIGAALPLSARNHRVWWANDAVGHSPAQLWLDAGWHFLYINLVEGRVTFSRIREREKAYIAFFSKLLDELKKKADFSVLGVSPAGASWIVIQTIPRGGETVGSFAFSFSRDGQFCVELYLALADRNQTKTAFDILVAQKDQLEAQAGPIIWERMDDRKAACCVLSHAGSILEEKEHAELWKWGAETMAKFYTTLLEPAEKAILEAGGR